MLVEVFLHTFFHMDGVGIDTHTIFCKSSGTLSPCGLMVRIQIHPPQCWRKTGSKAQRKIVKLEGFTVQVGQESQAVFRAIPNS